MVAKRRRITSSDVEKVAGFIKDEKKRRKDNKYRSSHEKRWKQVDRMVCMEPEPLFSGRSDPQEGWESNIELGSLADASEVITADVMRIIFPTDREFFRPHVKIEPEIDPESGVPIVKPSRQNMVDGVYKSLMAQQHKDFGLRQRIKLSIKEALHHGSFVAVVRWETQKQFANGRVRNLGSPVWVPYSMWNCYPDDSPSVIGTNLTYDGTMIIEEMIPLKTALQQKWMNLDKVKKEADKDKKDHITITHWFGDMFIPRSKGDGILVQNQHIITSNDHFLFSRENDTPYSPILFSGYERDDVLDPYYTSPLIKRSASQKIATHCANKFIEAIDLRTKPPLGYDANEPAFRESGGPMIAPGETFPLRAGGQIKVIEVADPSWALQGAQMFKGEVEEGTGVDVHRKGTSASVEQTAFEVDKVDQRSEVRTIDFVSTLEAQGMKPFLYMQHELNKQNLRPYGFFNNQLDTPDFMVIDKRDIAEYGSDAHFEVVGSKGVLGEERRRIGSLEVTNMFSANPLFSDKLNTDEIMLDAYRDVGVKDPERYIAAAPSEDPRLAALQQEAEQMIGELREENAKLELKVQQIPLIKAEASARQAAKEAQSIAFRSENKTLEEQIQLQAKADSREKQLFAAEKRLLVLRDQIGDLVLKARLEGQNVDEKEFNEKESEFNEVTKLIEEDRRDREQTKAKVVQFLKKRGSTEAQELVEDL